MLHTRTRRVKFTPGFAVCSRTSSGGLVGDVVGRVRLSSGICGPGIVRYHVSGTGGILVATRVCTTSTATVTTSHSTGIPRAERVCLHCRRQYQRTKTVSFSSVLLCACLLFGRCPRILSHCTRRFTCILMSRCRSAGCTRRDVM